MKQDGKHKKEELKKRLITMFSLFESKPHLMAEFFMKYNLISNKNKNQLLDNEFLEIMKIDLETNGEIEKPFFKNLTEMKNYYNSIFTIEIEKDTIIESHPILDKITRKENLIKQLEESIYNENFELAAQLRDYIKVLGIKIEKI